MRPYKELAAAIKAGGSVMLDDGRITTDLDELAKACNASKAERAEADAADKADTAETDAADSAEDETTETADKGKKSGSSK